MIVCGHRPQCYCLSRHVLAVPSFSLYGIIIASIKLSDFRLLSSMNRRLLIKRSDLWSKSEGIIKLKKALSFKRGLRSSQDLCQQIRLQRRSLSFFVDMPHSQWFERGSQKFSHKKNSSSKALPKWKVRCVKHLHLFYRCPLLFDRPKQFIRRTLLLRFYWIGLRSLYVDQDLPKERSKNCSVKI